MSVGSAPPCTFNMNPKNLVYLPVSGKTMDRANFRITDQDNCSVFFQREIISIRIHLCEVFQNINAIVIVRKHELKVVFASGCVRVVFASRRVRPVFASRRVQAVFVSHMSEGCLSLGGIYSMTCIKRISDIILFPCSLLFDAEVF